jgi:hypothetical protein
LLPDDLNDAAQPVALFHTTLTMVAAAGDFGMASARSLPLDPGQPVYRIVSDAMLHDLHKGRRRQWKMRTLGSGSSGSPGLS